MVVGDAYVGKTCMCYAFTLEKFQKQYTPTVFDNYSALMRGSSSLIIDLQMWDTPGKSDDKKIRSLSYPQTDVFILCFSLVSPESYNNIEKIWIPEIQTEDPNIPYILVGLKSDLRDSYPRVPREYQNDVVRPISTSEGEALKNKIGARYYIECSALDNYHIMTVFESAIDEVILPRERSTVVETINPQVQSISQNHGSASYTSIEYIRIQQFNS